MTIEPPNKDAVVAPTDPAPTTDDVAVVSSVGDLQIIRRHSQRAPYSQPTVLFPDGEAAHPGVVRPLYKKLAAGLVLTDCLSILLALTLVQLALRDAQPFSRGYLVGMAIAPAVWVAAFGAFGLYAMQDLSGPERIRRTIGATSAGLFVVALLMSWLAESFSGMELAALWGMTLALFYISRGQWHRFEQHLRERGRLSLRTVIVGTNPEARSLGHHLLNRAWGFDPLGYISAEGAPIPADSLPVLGTLDRLSDVIDELGADCVIVAVTAVQADDIRRILRVSRRAGVDVKVSAGLPMLLTSRVSVQSLAGAMAFAIRRIRLRRTQALVKRAFDLVGASLLLVVTAPVLVAVALAIRFTSPGPILFRQERVTRGLRAFTMFKFRTMAVDADQLIEQQSLDTSVPFFTLADDPRITRVGRIVRSMSLDELPQLWNVFRGDMSLVGPRPLPVEQVAANLDLLEPRHEVAAGLTGWWQINGRKNLTPEESLRLDLFYIENWSLPLDVYILARSLGAVLARRGAR